MIIDMIEEFFLVILEKIGLKKIADLYRKHQVGMRYLIFGGLSTVINILVFALCSKLLNFGTSISNVFAWVAAVLTAYITNKLWVFASKTENPKELIKEITSFFGARIFTLILETLFLILFIDKLHFNEIFMKIISNILVILINFVFSKIWIFKNQK